MRGCVGDGSRQHAALLLLLKIKRRVRLHCMRKAGWQKARGLHCSI